MTRVQLPPGCLGFRAQDGTRIAAENGAGSFAHVPDKYMPALKNNDYAQAGLVDAGPEKHFVVKGPEGRVCGNRCGNHTTWYPWKTECPSCGADTVPESEMVRIKPEGQYIP